MESTLKPLMPLFHSGRAWTASDAPRSRLEGGTAQYDIRSHLPVIVAETRIESDFDQARRRGSRILSDYLSGHNQSRTRSGRNPYLTDQVPSEKIARTSPVTLTQSPWGFLVQYAMPAGSTLDALPRPTDDRVHLREIPARRIAVVRYSGTSSEARYLKARSGLLRALSLDGIHTTGEPVFARFNSPFQPWFLQRNEVWIEVEP